MAKKFVKPRSVVEDKTVDPFVVDSHAFVPDNTQVVDLSVIKKTQKHLADPTVSVGAFITGLQRRAEIESGSKNFESLEATAGIPIPSVPMEYLLGYSGWPCGITLSIEGLPGVGKTGLCAEFLRWVIDLMGVGFYVDNETKHSPEWFRSIMGDEYYTDRLVKHYTNSLDGWQELIFNFIKQFKSFLEGTVKEPGPGRTVPAMIVLDTLSGKLSEKSQLDIATNDGVATPAYSLENNLTQRWLQTIQLAGWPLMLVFVNQLRAKEGGTETPTGGRMLQYTSSNRLNISKKGKAVASKNYYCQQFKFTNAKSSLTSPDRSVTVAQFFKYYRDASGRIRQKTVWDWDWSLINMLSELKSGTFNAYFNGGLLTNNFKLSGIHLEVASGGPFSSRAWSKDLGMGPSDAVPFQQLGRDFRKNPEIIGKIRYVLEILSLPYINGAYLGDRFASALPSKAAGGKAKQTKAVKSKDQKTPDKPKPVTKKEVLPRSQPTQPTTQEVFDPLSLLDDDDV